MRWVTVLCTLWFAFAAPAFAPPAFAQGRVALVIGNAAYAGSPLRNVRMTVARCAS